MFVVEIKTVKTIFFWKSAKCIKLLELFYSCLALCVCHTTYQCVRGYLAVIHTEYGKEATILRQTTQLLLLNYAYMK